MAELQVTCSKCEADATRPHTQVAIIHEQAPTEHRWGLAHWCHVCNDLTTRWLTEWAQWNVAPEVVQHLGRFGLEPIDLFTGRAGEAPQLSEEYINFFVHLAEQAERVTGETPWLELQSS